MLKWFKGQFSGGPYYLRLNRDRIAIRNVASGETVEFRCVMGFDGSGKITSIGDPISPLATRVVNPFDHPRLLVNDFTVAEKMCAFAFQQTTDMSPFRPAPVVVMHPDCPLDGGLTVIEARVLREMAEGGGARKVFVHDGPQLTDDEVRQIVDGGIQTDF